MSRKFVRELLKIVIHLFRKEESPENDIPRASNLKSSERVLEPRREDFKHGCYIKYGKEDRGWHGEGHSWRNREEQREGRGEAGLE